MPYVLMLAPRCTRPLLLAWITLASPVAAQSVGAIPVEQGRTAPASSPTAAAPGLPPPPAGYRYVPLASVRPSARQSIPTSTWEDGDPVPNGYHVQEEPRRGLVTAGYIVTAIPYGISAMVALSADFRNQSGYLLLPVVGPWMTLGRRDFAECENDSPSQDGLACLADAFVVMGLITDGIMQVAGATLLLTGYLATTKRLVPNGYSLTVLPQPIGTGYGLGARGTF